MATPVAEVVKVNWKQVFPWLALFRTLGLALHVRQILVGVIAAALIAVGHWLFLGSPVQRVLTSSSRGGNFASWVWSPVVDVAWPVLSLISRTIFIGPAPLPSWSIALQVVLLILWSGIVGGLAGGILVRRAAFEFSRDESLSLTAACRFVWQRGLDYLTAPALPLVIALGLGLILVVVGLLASVLPGGRMLLSATWGIYLVIGVVMAALLIAVALAWPLMVAAVSINSGDGFDALSRGFGFVLDRWRYYAWCLAIMTAYGSLIFFFAWVLLVGGDYIAISHVALGLGANPGMSLGSLPPALRPGPFDQTVMLLLTGFAYSFFWSNITVIYLVLRKSVDNAELDDIYIEGAPGPSDDLQALLQPRIPPDENLLPIVDHPGR